MTHRENGTSKLSMTGMTSSGTLIVLFGMYLLYVRIRLRQLVVRCGVVLENARMCIDQAVCSPSWALMSRLLYRFLAQLARLAVRSGRSKDLQIIVLRHENTVLRRQVGRPALTDDDRTLLDAIAAALPNALRQDWIVTPETLLR